MNSVEYLALVYISYNMYYWVIIGNYGKLAKTVFSTHLTVLEWAVSKGCLSICLSVSLSVALMSCIWTVKRYRNTFYSYTRALLLVYFSGRLIQCTGVLDEQLFARSCWSLCSCWGQLMLQCCRSWLSVMLLWQQKEELSAQMASFVSKLNTSLTGDVKLITPEIHNLLNRLVNADVDRVNFTSFDILVRSATSLIWCGVC